MLAMFVPFLAVNVLSYIPWAVIFLLLNPLGIRLYYLKKREECSRIQKRLQAWCSHTTDGGKGFGYSFGYWYAASINITATEYGEVYNVYLIATTESYKALTEDKNDDGQDTIFVPGEPPKMKNKISVYERTGSYANMWFRKRERENMDQAKPQQEPIVDAIVAHHKKKRHTVVYLHGPPCAGKSMVGILVANEFGSSFCNTIKPWQPGDTIGSLHGEVEPTLSKPLVIVFDEVDSALLKIHEGVTPHPKVATAVTDKPGWNHMLDEIQRGMYPDTILILTSNKSPEFIRSLDSSYIREGRIDLIFEMSESVL